MVSKETWHDLQQFRYHLIKNGVLFFLFLWVAYALLFTCNYNQNRVIVNIHDNIWCVYKVKSKVNIIKEEKYEINC